MKTLYLSDLDGTLLRSDERVSEYTTNIINRFIQNGNYFSYATARSIVTASKVTVGLNIEFPVICCNGAFIFKSITRDILISNYFLSEEVKYASEVLKKYNVYPVVSAFINGAERFAYIEKHISPATKSYLNTRSGDPRSYRANNTEELYSGDVFRISCMDTDDSLSPIKNIFQVDNRFSCIYQKAIYSGEWWCDILPVKATKANAALQLKSMLGCDKLVVFGDEHNDLSMFEIADESYAMANAVPKLKEVATAVICSNDNDGVAKWIESRILR